MTVPWLSILTLTCAAAVGFVLLSPRVARAERWRATVTPLASIIGSGFLVLGPILLREYGQLAPLMMLALCAVAYAFGSAIRFNIRYLEPCSAPGHSGKSQRVLITDDVPGAKPAPPIPTPLGAPRTGRPSLRCSVPARPRWQCSRAHEPPQTTSQRHCSGSHAHTAHCRARFSSIRRTRASARASASWSGMSSPLPKYISSGVCPLKAEWGMTLLCSST